MEVILLEEEKYMQLITPISIITGICENPEYAVAKAPIILWPFCNTDGRPMASPTRFGVKSDGGMPLSTPVRAVANETSSTGRKDMRHLTASSIQFGNTRRKAITKGVQLMASVLVSRSVS